MESNDAIAVTLIIPKRIVRMAAHNRFNVVTLKKCLSNVGSKSIAFVFYICHAILLFDRGPQEILGFLIWVGSPSNPLNILDLKVWPCEASMYDKDSVIKYNADWNFIEHTNNELPYFLIIHGLNLIS